MHAQKQGMLGAVWLTGLVAFSGCSLDSSSPGGSDKQTRVIMNVLSVFYGEFVDDHQGKPPQDSDEFRMYLESRQDALKRYNVENPDQILVSPRDGLPLVIVCGKRIEPEDTPGLPWAAYEQRGVAGMRMAVSVRGGARELSEEEIARVFLK